MAELIHSLFDMLMRQFILPQYHPTKEDKYNIQIPMSVGKIKGTPTPMEPKTQITVKRVACIPNEIDYRHLYTPSYCLHMCSLFKESLRSAVAYFGHKRTDINHNDRLDRNRMHTYMCSLYNYAHIGDYIRFMIHYTENVSDLYNRVRIETLDALDVDLDIICNTILVALGVGTSSEPTKDLFIWGSEVNISDHCRCITTEMIGYVTYNVIMVKRGYTPPISKCVKMIGN